MALLGVNAGFGQLASTTSLVGNVTDTAGAAISGAEVTAKNTETAEILRARTNGEGHYDFQFVRNGTYDISVSQSGFETVVKQGVPVAVNQTVRNDFTLAVGQVTQQVVVTADVPPISTEDATLTEVIGAKAVTELPLNSRNALRLAITVPTVIPGRKSASGNPGGGEGYIGAGTREIQNSVSMDGVSIMNNLITTTTFRPSVDAIQETQIQTGTYPAQYGHYMGVQINVITKGGTNSLHGSVFEFLRNNALDARGYFENRSIPQAPLRQNQFGYALSGPVVLPGLYDGRNRTFFLSNYEGMRNRQAVPTIDTVLTPAMRRGDFSELTNVQIVDPLAPGRPAFPNNQIPQSRLSPQAVNALQYMPLPTTSGVTNNFNVNVPNSNDGNQLIHRVDHSITESARLFARYAWANTDLVNGNSNPFNGYTQPVRDRNLVVGYTQVFSPTVVNDFRVGQQHTRIDSINFFTGNNDAAGTELGIPGYTSGPDNPGLPNLGITGYMPIGGQNMASSNWYQNDTTTQFADSLNITRGKHTIAAGFDTRRVATGRTANNNPRGGFTFSGTIAGNGAADFMLGLPLQVTTPGPAFRARVGQWRHGFFVSDKWQTSRKLTLTLGLRYELLTVPKSLNGLARILNPEMTVFIPAQVPQVIDLTNPDRNNWAPRIGFAYRLTDSWVINGGYGIYYNANQTNSYTLATTNPPFSTIFTYNATPANPILSLENPTPTTAQAGAPARPNAFHINPELPTAMMNQWSFSIEHGLWRNAGFEAQYLGSKSTHLDRSFQVNQPSPGPGAVALRQPNQLFGNIRMIQNDMIANYNALSLIFRQQYRAGLTLLMSYTWSKTLDVTTDSNGGGQPMDAYNWRLDYGRSNWDLPHRFVASWTYELPFLKGTANPFLKHAIAGWQVNGIWTSQSGYPFNVTIPGDPANVGFQSQRPNLLKQPTADCGAGKLTNCISADAFALPTAFTFGNTPRNALRGPGFTNIDFSLFKNVSITENTRLQIRGEAFNLSNTPAFGNPNATFNTPQFGSVTGTQNNNRQIQLGLKLLF